MNICIIKKKVVTLQPIYCVFCIVFVQYIVVCENISAKIETKQ